MRLRLPGSSGINFFQIAKRALNLREVREHRVVGLGEALQNLRREFREAAAVGRERIAREQRFLLAGLQVRGFDFGGLMFQKIRLAPERRLAHRQFVMLRNERVQLAEERLIFRAQLRCARERVEKVELIFRREQRLVVVRSV